MIYRLFSRDRLSRNSHEEIIGNCKLLVTDIYLYGLLCKATVVTVVTTVALDVRGSSCKVPVIFVQFELKLTWHFVVPPPPQ